MSHPTNPLFLPGGKVHHVKAAARPIEFAEPYPDELEKINAVGREINAKFSRTYINDDEWPNVIEYIIEKFDAIGWEVGVEPMDAFHKDGRQILDNDGRPVRVPNVALLGRSRNKETEADHDRIAHGVVRGLVDGRKGYIREGSDQLHEDPIKKIIT